MALSKLSGNQVILRNPLGGSRGLVSKLDEMKSVKDFGAIGDGNPLTNDTAAFLAAIAWMVETGRPVFVPPGYYFTDPLVLHKNYFGVPTLEDPYFGGFYGVDKRTTVIQCRSTTAPLLTIGSADMLEYSLYLSFSNLTLRGLGNAAGSGAVLAYDLAWANFDNCIFQVGAVAFDCRGGVKIDFKACVFQFGLIGLRVTQFSRAGGGWPNAITVDGGTISSNSLCGVFFDYGRQLALKGVQIENNGTLLGDPTQGGVIVGPNVGLETGAGVISTNPQPGLSASKCWFENNRGIADVYAQNGITNLTENLYWSTTADVTNNIRITGGRFNVNECDCGWAFSAGSPNFYSGPSVFAGNSITNCEFATATWDNQKTTVINGLGVFAPTLVSAGSVSANTSASVRALQVAPVYNALLGGTPTKPVLIIGADASGTTATVPFGRTMANNGSVVQVQANAAGASTAYCPVITAVTTTGFTVRKDKVVAGVVSQENYVITFMVIGEEA